MASWLKDLEPSHPVLERKEPSCDVSIIIVNWNTQDLLKNCLESIYGQTKGVDFEVVVVDNASSDGSCAMIEREFPQAVLLRNEANEGFSRGCNKGMRHARGRYLLLLNSDTVVVGNAMNLLVQFMDKNPRLGAGGCALLYPEGDLQPSCGRFPRLPDALLRWLSITAIAKRARDKRKYFASPFLSYEQHQHEREADWIVGACIIARREAIEQVGLMDETIFLFAEEWDWCYRIKAGGWRIRYTPEPRIVHLCSASWTMTDGKRVRAILSSQQYFYHKNYGRLKAALFKFSTLVEAVIKVLLWMILYTVFPRQRAYYLDRCRWNLHAIAWCISRDPQRMIRAQDLEPPPTQEARSAENPRP